MSITSYIDKCKNKWSGRKYTPSLIVCHITEGTYNSAINWFLNTNSYASSHYIIARTGDVAQMVALSDSAWCNGDLNNPTSKIVKEMKINPNLYSYSIEHEGYSYKELYGGLTDNQYKSTLEICKKIITWHNSNYSPFIIDREHIIGHFEINSVDKKNCPGKNFPFDKLIKDLQDYFNPPFEINTIIYPTKDIISYETAGYPNSKTGIIKKNTKCIVKKYHYQNGIYIALGNTDYFPYPWTNNFEDFTTTEPIIKRILNKIFELLKKTKKKN